MKTYGGNGCVNPCFLDSQLHATDTNRIGGWVSPRARLDDVDGRKLLTLLRLEPKSHCRAASCQLLYRLPASS
jgi:hypothetical protein